MQRSNYIPLYPNESLSMNHHTTIGVIFNKNLFKKVTAEITQSVLLLLFPYQMSAIPFVKNLSTPTSQESSNITAFFNEWLFSCHYRTTQLSFYLRPCEPFISAKRLSANSNQIVSTLRVSTIPNSPKSLELGDLFSVTVEVFAFFI